MSPPDSSRDSLGGLAFLGVILRRYALVSMSSALVSVAHLLVQLAAIRSLNASSIGLLAFMITLITFGFGISNALVSAPYTILANRADGGERAGLPALITINLLLSAAWGMVCLGVAGYSAGPAQGVAFGATALLQLMRWFARSRAYAENRPGRAVVSDIVYTIVLIGGVGTLMLTSIVTLLGVGLTFTLASLLALLPFGLTTVYEMTRIAERTKIAAYRGIWREQASWALLGVGTSEATANGHSYLVTMLFGPAAFAPIAIGTLFLRPLSVCITALTQIERPRMARHLDAGDTGAALRSTWHFTMALILAWLATATLAATILFGTPHVVIRHKLDRTTVTEAVLLCGGAMLLQCIQTPRNVLLQAADRFRLLAMTSVRACVVTLALVGALLLVAQPVWSLAGVAAGQAVMLFEVARAVRRWRSDGATGTRRVSVEEP